jgi:hypothetical protein
MTETLLHILGWIGVVYFLVHFCKLFVLIGKGFVRRQKSIMQKEAIGREPKRRLQHSNAFSNNPAHQ